MANLANKYRPSAFSDMTEQSLIVDILENICKKELINRNFLFIGPAGCGKTTLARIMGNILNDNKGEPIEIDAASHSGVDKMREIIQQAHAYPIGCAYKIFIVDECFSGDTKVLTDKGFKRFDQLDHTEKIAQYHNDGSIEFVTPLRWISKPHTGDMIKLYPKHGDRYALMTPGHNQPVYNYYSNTVETDEIGNITFKAGDELLLSGKGVGCDDDITDMERLIIASIADGHRCAESSDKHSKWQIRLSRPDKVKRLLELFEFTGVNWSQYKSEPGVFEYGYYLPSDVTKDFTDSFSLDFSFKRANQFIDEIMCWDGSYKSGYPAYFSSVNKANSDFVSAVGTLGGYSVQEVTHEYDNPNHKTEYQVCMIPGNFNRRFKPHMELTTFNGTVYCVEVPTHKIVVQAQGFTFISGNCHSLSSQAWQALLKTLEESPAKSIFVFCTTNPEKIPATIISRVQTFQLSKISLDGITSRLLHVLQSEVSEGRTITYTESAVSYIAKLANGGMRDALTLLDKALSYSDHITSETLTQALGLPNYEDYFTLLNAIAKRDNTAVSDTIHNVYNSGVNFVKWFEGFHSFVINIVKYIFLHDIDKTMIPSHYAEKISKYTTAHSALCLKLANKLVKMNQELKSTNYQQEIALTYLCSIPASK